MKYLLSYAFVLFYFISQAQPSLPSCPSDELLIKLLGQNPAFLQQMELYERTYQREVATNARKLDIVYTIPAVIHIFHSGQPIGAPENPSDISIENIINEATQRFRHTQQGADDYNNLLYGVDSEIEFCIAKVDPTGNATSGILRYNIPSLSEGEYPVLYPQLNPFKWDITKYMNIFIVADLIGAGGVYIGGTYDFTIYNSGSFWSGLVAHEQGHYFSLNHTFYSGNCVNNNCLIDGDKVCDTPPKAMSGMQGGTCEAPNNSCTTDDDDLSNTNPYRPISLGGLGDQLDMLANYMDYTFNCWDAFTTGQRTRMRFNIVNSRQSILNNSDVICNLIPEILGCTDPLAHNYNPNATNDNGSCETCYDGFLNGDETEIDCGGSLCNSCLEDCVLSNYTLTLWDDWCLSFGFSGATLNVQGPSGNYYLLTELTFGNGSLAYQYNTDVQVGIADIDIEFQEWKVSDISNPECNFHFVVDNVCNQFNGFGCTNGLAHNYNPDATDDNGSCETCYDGIRNGDEIEVDCGGSLCGPCLPSCGVDISIETVECTSQNVTFDFHLTTTYYTNVYTQWLEEPSNSIVNQDLLFVLLNENFPNPEIGQVTFPNTHSKYTLVFFFNVAPGIRYCFDTLVLDNPCDNPILGCTDSQSHNFNPNATENDGSCQTCNDGILNGDETGIDCGGALCGVCPSIELFYDAFHLVFFCPDDSVLVQVKPLNGKPPFIYYWTSSNDMFVTDFSSVWFNKSGNYSVCVESPNLTSSCMNFELVEHEIGCVSLEESNITFEVASLNRQHSTKDYSKYSFTNDLPNQSLIVYPIPTLSESSVIVEIPEKLNGDIFYQLLDLNGAIVQSNKVHLESQKLFIELDNVPSGTYIIKVFSSRLYIGKIIVL